MFSTSIFHLISDSVFSIVTVTTVLLYDWFTLHFSDKRFSALGFGARIPPNYEVSIILFSCYNLFPHCLFSLSPLGICPCLRSILNGLIALFPDTIRHCQCLTFQIHNWVYFYSQAPSLEIPVPEKITCSEEIKIMASKQCGARLLGVDGHLSEGFRSERVASF